MLAAKSGSKGLETGVQKVGTTGTAGAGQTIFGWTKRDLDEKVIENYAHFVTISTI